MSNTKTKQNNGFSLIETLIAIAILMIAIAGPLTLIQAGLFSSVHERNQVTAIYLAQEAIEYIKNLRDQNSYSQYGTLVGYLTGPDGSPMTTTCYDGCYLDPHGKLSPGNAYLQPVSGLPKYLFQNVDANGAISYDYQSGLPGGKVTSYDRKVTIRPINPSSTEEAVVTVTINWDENSIQRNISVSTNLYNYEVGDSAP